MQINFGRAEMSFNIEFAKCLEAVWHVWMISFIGHEKNLIK